MYIGTFAHAKAPMDASAMVTAGLRCAPLMLFTQYTAIVTANAQPAVMTIQPELLPFVRCSTTLATTPSPSTMRIVVPNSSARMGDIARGLPRHRHPARMGGSRRLLPARRAPTTAKRAEELTEASSIARAAPAARSSTRRARGRATFRASACPPSDRLRRRRSTTSRRTCSRISSTSASMR